MLNKELIEYLLKFPLNTEVWHEDLNFGDPLERLDSGDIKYKEKYNKILIIAPQQDYLD